MRSSLCGKEGEREQNLRNETREANTQRRKIITEAEQAQRRLQKEAGEKQM